MDSKTYPILFYVLYLRNHGGGNQIELLAALRGERAAALGEGLNKFEGLELLENVTNDSVGSASVVRAASTRLAGATILVSQDTNTSSGAEVDTAGNRGSADVVPVGVQGSKVTVSSGLDEINPLRKLEGAGLLEVGSVGLDEVLGRDVLECDAAAGRSCRCRCHSNQVAKINEIEEKQRNDAGGGKSKKKEEVRNGTENEGNERSSRGK